MAGTMKQLLIIALFSILTPCFGYTCQTSLPPKFPIPNDSKVQECYRLRREGLAQRQAMLSLTKPAPPLYYPRLNKSIPEFLEFLKNEPFWIQQAQLQMGLAKALNATLPYYLMATKNLSNIPQIPEYKFMTEFFGDVPTSKLGEVMRRPSDYELFQDRNLWITNDLFGDQRLAGNNPMSLKRVYLSGDQGIQWEELQKNLNKNFNWGAALKRSTCDCEAETEASPTNNDSIEKAIKEGRIYVLRLPLCDDLPLPNIDYAKPPQEQVKRTLWKLNSPIALFEAVQHKDRKKKRLRPFAIQMDYKQESKVYTPMDSCAWTLAKLNVQLTDLLHAQLVEHLGKVHFTVEALCITLERQLSKYHPLQVIMKYHCSGAVTSNTMGVPLLVSPRGYVDQLFPVGWQGALELIRRASAITDWEDMDLRTDLLKRGVHDKDILPYYPYRDDGLELVKVIEGMVKDYVNVYYKNNNDVLSDYELQSFADEVSRDGNKGQGGAGNIKGFPATIKNKKELIDTFSRMIWLMTGQHAAVNFPISDYAVYPPNNPTKLYTDERGPENKYSMYNLPYRATSAFQHKAFFTLGLMRLDNLFDYGSHLTDGPGRRVVYKHYKILFSRVEPILDKRNKERYNNGHLTYPYFIPRWMPNGVQT